MHHGYHQGQVERLQAAAAARLNNFHGAKRQLLGNKVVPAPAWKSNVMNGASGDGGAATAKELGSKILLSKLPNDVTPTEVEELFKKTVGPLKDMFLVYNHQGKSKGMAVVTFTRPGDAAVARQKYDGKIVDGRRRIKIEVIYDGIPGQVDQQLQTTTPALLNRLGGKLGEVSASVSSKAPSPRTPPLTLQQRTQLPSTGPAAAPTRRVRFKKGPKRLSKKHVALAGTTSGIVPHVKKGPMSKDDLDKEMEDYRAAAVGSGFGV